MDFPAGEAFGDLLRSAGFADVRSQPLTFGIVWLYIAVEEHVGEFYVLRSSPDVSRLRLIADSLRGATARRDRRGLSAHSRYTRIKR